MGRNGQEQFEVDVHFPPDLTDERDLFGTITTPDRIITSPRDVYSNAYCTSGMKIQRFIYAREKIL